MSTNVGIRGLGVYLPPEVRRNDWWAEHVARWMEERRAAARPLPEARTEGERRVLEQLAIQVRDPFQGSAVDEVANGFATRKNHKNLPGTHGTDAAHRWGGWSDLSRVCRFCCRGNQVVGPGRLGSDRRM